MDLEDGYRFLVDFEQDGVPGLLMDEPEPLGDGSGPNAARVLAAAIGRVSGIRVLIEPVVEGSEQPRMHRYLELFEDFCVVTQSVRAGINVDVDVEPTAARGRHEHCPRRVGRAYARPRQRFGTSIRTYSETAVLDELRRTDFARLDRGGHVYLDYTGGGLYADSQLVEHMRMLRENVFGNPHSVNPTSAASTELLERARARVLEFFRASPDEYEAIFTPNATGALRLVGEAYPFREGDRFLLTFDNHNSVNGIREFARARGAETTYVPSVAPDLRVDESLLPRYLTDTAGDHHNLFAYPAQSNFSGAHHPLEWIEHAHAHGWHVLLDAAAYVPNEPTRPQPLAPGLRGALLLQDVRVADRSRLSARPPRAPSPSSSVHGSPAARSSPRSSSASTTSPHRAPRTSRTAPSTT